MHSIPLAFIPSVTDIAHDGEGKCSQVKDGPIQRFSGFFTQLLCRFGAYGALGMNGIFSQKEKKKKHGSIFFLYHEFRYLRFNEFNPELFIGAPASHCMASACMRFSCFFLSSSFAGCYDLVCVNLFLVFLMLKES